MIFTDKNGNEATTLNWIAPTERTDGTRYGATDHQGYELGVSDPAVENDGFVSFVSVPAKYEISKWPLDQLNMLSEGLYEVALRTVDSRGRVSPWSSPLSFSAGLAVPSAPTGLSVS